jgi:Tol biopolymer transport system component
MLWLERVSPNEPDERLMIGDPDGTDAVEVARFEDYIAFRGRAWSPDSSRVAYSALTRDGAGLWVVDASTGASTRIRSWPEPLQVDVAWSPDGSRLAVAAASDGVWTMAPDGSDARQVSSLAAWRIGWSSSEPLLVAEARAPGEGTSGVWVIATDGSAQRRLSPADVLEVLPLWSPDGHWIAFASERQRTSTPDPATDAFLTEAGIYVMRSDGSDIRRVVPPPASGWPEAWFWFTDEPPT